MNKSHYDVIIIGGSYAGLSAAMALGRSLRKVLIIDDKKPCNRYTPHSQNFLTHDGAAPAEIAKIALDQVLKYKSVTAITDTAIKAGKTGDFFEVVTQNKEVITAGKLLFATGIKDEWPEIKGFEECWGRSIIHCPYCHGYEYKGKKTALWADGDKAFHLAALVSNLTHDLTIITTAKSDLSKENLKKFEEKKIRLIEKTVTEISHHDGQKPSLHFEDNTQETFDAVYAALPFIQHSSLPMELGCEITESGHFKVDNMQKTTVDGVFACGDNSSPMRSVASAVATGNLAGAAINALMAMKMF